jgi:aminopeptidase N
LIDLSIEDITLGLDDSTLLGLLLKLMRKHQYRAKPTHYKISIHDIEFGGNFTYKGTVAINLNIRNDGSWNDLVLNAHQLKIHSAELKTDTTSNAKDISYDEKRQRVTLDFGKKIQYSGEAVLTVKFEGTINNVRTLDLP